MDRPEARLRASSRGKCVQFCPPIMCNLEPPLTLELYHGIDSRRDGT